MTKVQCWDFKKCGRDKDKSCPAVVQYAGRTCWLIEGTFCGGKVQATQAEKVDKCASCDFYSHVKAPPTVQEQL